MCESIVVVGAALSADVDAPTERVHSAPGARRGQSPQPPTGERSGRENTEESRVGAPVAGRGRRHSELAVKTGTRVIRIT
jgi:hypothetical protein